MKGTMIHISQGEHAVGSAPEAVLTTTLGSCVAVCLWDKRAGVGGMNHMLLPEAADAHGLDTAGAVAMERLINDLVREGGVRSALAAKVFGGASMLRGVTDIGARNVAFARAYLAAEGIRCEAEDTGGERARRVRFHPASGAAQVRRVRRASAPIFTTGVAANGVELF